MSEQADLNDVALSVGQQAITDSQARAVEKIDKVFGTERPEAPEPTVEAPFITVPWQGREAPMTREQAQEHILTGISVANHYERLSAMELELQQKAEGLSASRDWEAFMGDPNNAPTVQRIQAVLRGERLASELAEAERHQQATRATRPKPRVEPEVDEFAEFLGEDEDELPSQPTRRANPTRMPKMGEANADEPPEWARTLVEEQRELKQRLAAWDEHQRQSMAQRQQSERETQAQAILSRIDGAILGDPDLREDVRVPGGKDRLRRMVIAEMNATGTNDPSLAVKVIGDAQRERDERRMQSLLAGREKLERAHGTPPSGGSRSIPTPTTNERAPSLENPREFAAHVRRMTGL